jgi:hypothetical protein
MPPVIEGYGDYTAQVMFAMFQLVILAFVVERALFIAFDIKWWRDRLDDGLKAVVAVGVSIGICWLHDFDILALATETEASTTTIGIILTGLVVAGGSAGAMQLMQNVLRLGRMARDQANTENAAKLVKAEAVLATAQAENQEAQEKLRKSTEAVDNG